MAATVYVISTNGVALDTTYTSKARALGEAANICDAADARGKGDVITVATQKTGKIVYTHVALNSEATDTGDMIVSDAAADLSTMITETLSGVVITGESPESWAPDFDASGAAECYFGCGVAPVAVFVDYVGRTEGVCASHRDRVEGKTYDVPATAHTDAQTLSPAVEMVRAIQNGETPVACVIQNTPGMSGVSHYHSPACADVKREMRKFGQSQSDVMYATFATVADILVFEDGGRGSDYAEEFTPEWWVVVMENSTSDVRIMPCLSIPAGRVGDSPLVTQGNFFRAGFDQPSEEKRAEYAAEIESHNFNTCDEKECITCAVKLYEACKGNHTGDNVCAACDAFENARVIPATVEPVDAPMITRDYLLSVTVDEMTGATIDLGWVTLTVPAQFAESDAHIAAVYGAVHGEGMPRNGWESIITVRDWEI